MSVAITNVSCTSASGTFALPTTAVTDCYFQDQGGNQFHAATINNNSPGPGDWNASNFVSKPSPAQYGIFALGNDDGQNPAQGDSISC